MKIILISLMLVAGLAWAGAKDEVDYDPQERRLHETREMNEITDRRTFSQFRALQERFLRPLTRHERGLAVDILYAYYWKHELNLKGVGEMADANSNRIFWLNTHGEKGESEMIRQLAHTLGPSEAEVEYVRLPVNADLVNLNTEKWLRGKTILVIDGLDEVSQVTPQRLGVFIVNLAEALRKAYPWSVDAFVIDNKGLASSISSYAGAHLGFLLDGSTYVNQACEDALVRLH